MRFAISLAEAVNGLKGFVANKQDVDQMRNARNQIHQANGALQLLDLRGVALVTEAIEHLTRRFETDPKECAPTPIRTIETALSAVMAYLEGLLSGRPNQPIKLYPYYRDVLLLNQATPRSSGRSGISGPVAAAGVSSDRGAQLHAAPAARSACTIRVGPARLSAQLGRRRAAQADARSAVGSRAHAAARTCAQFLVDRARAAGSTRSRRGRTSMLI